MQRRQCSVLQIPPWFHICVGLNTGCRSGPFKGHIRIRMLISKLDRFLIGSGSLIWKWWIWMPPVSYIQHLLLELRIFLSLIDYHWLLYKYEFSAHCIKFPNRWTLIIFIQLSVFSSFKKEKILDLTCVYGILNSDPVPQWHLKVVSLWSTECTPALCVNSGLSVGSLFVIVVYSVLFCEFFIHLNTMQSSKVPTASAICNQLPGRICFSLKGQSTKKSPPPFTCLFCYYLSIYLRNSGEKTWQSGGRCHPFYFSEFKFPKFAATYFQGNVSHQYSRKPLKYSLLPLQTQGDQLVSHCLFLYIFLMILCGRKVLIWVISNWRHALTLVLKQMSFYIFATAKLGFPFAENFNWCAFPWQVFTIF